jgi:hypothetical protein
MRDDDLEQLERRYRALANEEPPELVDQAVLNRARAAAEKRTRSWPWTRGWAHNLATAAVVVLAVTVLLQLRDDSGEPPAPSIPPLATDAATPSNATTEQTAEKFSTHREKFPPRAMQAPAPQPSARSGSRDEASRIAPAPEDRLQAAPVADEAKESRDPESWLAHIQSLRERGEAQAAARELDAFRAAYPDYPLPPELAD